MVLLLAYFLGVARTTTVALLGSQGTVDETLMCKNIMSARAYLHPPRTSPAYNSICACNLGLRARAN